VGLLVSGFALFELHEEAVLLVRRVVELGEGVGDLPAVDVKLEAVHDLGVLRVLPRQRGDLEGVAGHERGLNELFLHGLVEDRHQDLAQRLPVLEKEPALRGLPERPAPVVQGGGVEPRVSDEGLPDGYPAPGGREVQLRPLVGDLQGPEEVPDERGDHLLGERHEVLVRGVGHVEFDHGELGVVQRRDPLVAEIAVELEDPLHPAHDEPLEVELRRDPQVEVLPQGVVVRLEGLGHGPPGHGLHHGRLHLEEVPVVQERPDEPDDPAARLEDILDLRVDDQVEVALSVADLHVRQPVPLFRQGPQALGEEPQPLGLDREFPRSRLDDPAREVDDIAHVDRLEQGKELVAEPVLADKGLDPPFAVLDGDKGPLAEIADCHHPAGNGETFRHLLERLVVHLPEGRVELCGEMGHLCVVGIGFHARSGEGLDLVLPHLQEVAVFHRPSQEWLICNRPLRPACRNKVNFTIFYLPLCQG